MSMFPNATATANVNVKAGGKNPSGTARTTSSASSPSFGGSSSCVGGTSGRGSSKRRMATLIDVLERCRSRGGSSSGRADRNTLTSGRGSSTSMMTAACTPRTTFDGMQQDASNDLRPAYVSANSSPSSFSSSSSSPSSSYYSSPAFASSTDSYMYPSNYMYSVMECVPTSFRPTPTSTSTTGGTPTSYAVTSLPEALPASFVSPVFAPRRRKLQPSTTKTSTSTSRGTNDHLLLDRYLPPVPAPNFDGEEGNAVGLASVAGGGTGGGGGGGGAGGIGGWRPAAATCTAAIGTGVVKDVLTLATDEDDANLAAKVRVVPFTALHCTALHCTTCIVPSCHGHWGWDLYVCICSAYMYLNSPNVHRAMSLLPSLHLHTHTHRAHPILLLALFISQHAFGRKWLYECIKESVEPTASAASAMSTSIIKPNTAVTNNTDLDGTAASSLANGSATMSIFVGDNKENVDPAREKKKRRTIPKTTNATSSTTTCRPTPSSSNTATVSLTTATHRLCLRCRHCRDETDVLRPKSVSEYHFYSKIVRWSAAHYESCPAVPPALHARYEEAKANASRGRKQFWAESAAKIGLVNIVDESGQVGHGVAFAAVDENISGGAGGTSTGVGSDGYGMVEQ